MVPCRWLTSQQHLFCQHLLQTLAVNPKSIDGCSLAEFHTNLIEDVPPYVEQNSTTQKLYHQLCMQVEAVIRDSNAGILADCRPRALAALRIWEENLNQTTQTAESSDKKDSEAQWKQWAKEAAANGAGKAHRWTKVPVAWRPHISKTAAYNQQYALPENFLNDLHEKFEDIWHPAAVPLPLPRTILFPEWLPHNDFLIARMISKSG